MFTISIYQLGSKSRRVALTEQVVVWIPFIFKSQATIADMVQVFQPLKIGYCYPTCIQVKILQRNSMCLEVLPCDRQHCCITEKKAVLSTNLNHNTEDNPDSIPIYDIIFIFFWRLPITSTDLKENLTLEDLKFRCAWLFYFRTNF